MVNSSFQPVNRCSKNTVFQPRRTIVCSIKQSMYKENIIQFDLLKKHVIETLQTYAVFFRDGEFGELHNGMQNIQPLAEFMLIPENLKVTRKQSVNYIIEDDLIEQYKSFLFIIVDEFKQVLRLTTLNTNLQNQVDTLQESDRTLKNLELLKAFVKKYYGGFHSNSQIEVEHTLSEPLQIQPEYLVYMQRHGPPSGGLFETEKMEQIKLEIYGVSQNTATTLAITEQVQPYSNVQTPVQNPIQTPVQKLDNKIDNLRLKLKNTTDQSVMKVIELRIANLQARRIQYE